MNTPAEISSPTPLALIREHTLEIKTPFQDDFWGRETLADRLTDYVSRLNIGATIAIDAEWGAGKSWFVNNWKSKLDQSGFKVIYLNAFNQDYIDDPFLTISMEIANCIKDDRNSFESIKETIGKAYRAVLPNLPMLLWYLTTSLVGMGAIAKPIADAVKTVQEDEFAEEAGKLLNEKLQEHLSAQVENYENEKQSLEYFKSELAKITEKLDQPLVFIVDELDRCKPEFAIRLIERIKHFFDIPKVVFVLAVNKKQLEESINSFYGFTSAYNYLEKFIDFSVMLKNHDSDGERYTRILKKYNEDLGLNIGENIYNYYVNLCKIYNPNPRQLIRIINKFSLLKSNQKDDISLFLFLILIYNELNLIEEFNEINFVEHFYDTHITFYKKDIDEYNKIYSGNSSNNALDYFVNHIYQPQQNFKNNPFTILFSFINSVKMDTNHVNIKQFRKYYLTRDMGQNEDIDLIQKWHKYIHMITD